MKSIRKIFSAAMAVVLGALLSISCSKEENVQANNEKAGITVSIDGELGALAQIDDTKSSLSNPITLKWIEEDKVYAFDGVKCLGALDVTLKEGKDYYALLSGELDAPAEGTAAITLVHAPGLTAEKAAAFTGGNLSFDLSSQSGAVATAPFVAYATMEYKEGQTSIDKLVVNFTFATSIIRINCSGMEASMNFTTIISGMSNECVLEIDGDGVSVGTGTTGNISLASAKTNAQGTKMLYAGLARTASKTDVSVVATQGSKSYEGAIVNGSAWAAKTAYNTICPLKKVVYYFTVSELSEVDPDAKRIIFAPGNLYCTRTGGEGNWSYSFEFEKNQWDYRGICIDGYTYYSTYDIIQGIFIPVPKEEIESTLPGIIYEENTSGLFQWISESCTGSGAEEARKNFGAFSYLSLSDSERGTKDDDELDFGKALGEDSRWRTPTYKEWKYLMFVRKVNGNTGYGNTCVAATLDNGVSGLIIFPDNYTGETDGSRITSIPEGCTFLPAAGWRFTHEVRNIQEFSSYWSSSACLDDAAWYFYFKFNSYSGGIRIEMDCNERDDGRCVRLISELE